MPPGSSSHLLFPLASGLIYVAAALSLKRASERGGGLWRATFVMNMAAAACFAPLLLGAPGPGPKPPWQPVMIAAVYVVAQALTMMALSWGDVSVATPVMGLKVIFVAALAALLVGDRLTADLWAAAGMSTAGIALLNAGGAGKAGRGKLGPTVAAALGAAACYALFDVLVRAWAGARGVGRLLPAIMGAAAVMSLALWPLFEGPLAETPREARTPLLLGSALVGLQALLLVRTLGLYPDTTRINVVYNARGLWSVLAVWLVGHWWGNTELKAGRTVFAWRLAGAALLLAAIVVAVAQPFQQRSGGEAGPASATPW